MAVREGLLSLLEPGPRYGYQLKTEFEAVTGGVWPLNVGQVYTTLDRLERDGLVTISEADGQKSYTLTASGREQLGAWWRAIPAEDPPPRDELMLKVLMAIERGREHALSVITHQRTALFALLQRHRRPSGGAPSSLAARLVADALVVRAEADLRWLDLCESRITRKDTP
jgi:DNA-binding PadR family transcriptional regulator